VDFDDKVRALLILCSLPKSCNGLVMVVSNSVSGSNTLKLGMILGAKFRSWANFLWFFQKQDSLF
jgi:hypothetical protein